MQLSMSRRVVRKGRDAVRIVHKGENMPCYIWASRFPHSVNGNGKVPTKKNGSAASDVFVFFTPKDPMKVGLSSTQKRHLKRRRRLEAKGKRCYNCQYCGLPCTEKSIDAHEDACGRKHERVLKRRRKTARKGKYQCKCQYCGKSLHRGQVRGHEESCPRNPFFLESPVVEEEPKIEEINPYACQHCGLSCTEKYVGAHEVVCSQNPDVQLINALAATES